MRRLQQTLESGIIIGSRGCEVSQDPFFLVVIVSYKRSFESMNTVVLALVEAHIEKAEFIARFESQSTKGKDHCEGSNNDVLKACS